MLMRREMALGGLVVAAGAGMSAPSNAAPGVFTEDGFAIGGYDSVSYFTAKKAAMGQVAHNFEWKGVNWLFNGQANRDAFASAPDRFAPGFTVMATAPSVLLAESWCPAWETCGM